MNFILILIIILFTFLGMFIGKKYDLKYFSINSIFGLFLVNGLFNILISSNFLSHNYHNSTWIYLILSLILGYLIMKIIETKSDNPDDIAIASFSFLNCFLLFIGKINIIIFLINIIYFILIGIYIKDTKSYINVFIGFLLAFILSFISNWMLGFIISTLIGFIIYFLVSIYILVTRNNEKLGLTGLIIGILIAVIGGVL